MGIILGGVIFAIALFGCCGAWKENKCLIYTYGTILFFILIAQIAAGIAAFALRGPLKDEITKNMEKGQLNYGQEGFEGVTTTWDLVQKNLHCCGVNNFKDWKNVTQMAGGVPDSCCKAGQVMNCGKAPVEEKTSSPKVASPSSMTSLTATLPLWELLLLGLLWVRSSPSPSPAALGRGLGVAVLMSEL